MALKSRAISLFLLLNILLAMAGHALASRAGPTKNNEEDRKQPEWFIEPDGSVLIPGVGRILVPMPGHSLYHVPSYGGNRGNYGGNGGNYGGSGGKSGSTHIPGGDDTFVPNPGYAVPVPSTP